MKPGVTADRLGLADLPEISDLLLRADTFRFRVASRSMVPTLRIGDQLIVEPAATSHLRVGDMILFHRQGQLICHRLVAVEETGPVPGLITKGDAGIRDDEPLHPDQVLGRVIEVKRRRFWVGPVANHLDLWRERLSFQIGQGLGRLQSLPAYRRTMKTLFNPWFTYCVGVLDGRRWYRYLPIRSGEEPPEIQQAQRFHLIAKFAGTCVGSSYLVVRAGQYWLQDLHVRHRYRGCGIGSQLVRLAGTIGSWGGAERLLTTVGEENSTALRLFEKTGFRPHPDPGPPGTTTLVLALHPRLQGKTPPRLSAGNG